MEQNDILALFDREQRREVMWPGAERQSGPDLVRHIIPGERTCVIVYSALGERDVDPVIEHEMQLAAGLGYELSWKVYAHDRPVDLRPRLVAHGFDPQELEAVCVLDLAAAEAAPLLDQATSAGLDVRRVRGRDEMQDAIEIEEEVWGNEHKWMYALADELASTPESLSMYAAYVDGVPASVAWIRFHPGSRFASLWGGSTRARYRGRGLYTALLALRAQEARQRGARYLTIDASPMSQPIVQRFGFRLITHTQDHDWQPAGAALTASQTEEAAG